MPDTDRLVAAIFAAAMNASAPTADGLLTQYEYFVQEIPARRKAAQKKLEETDQAAWTKRSY
jgi:hypothetical protein